MNLSRIPVNEKRRIRSETEILASLHHPHIINFYHVWESPATDSLCFTTEIVTSGTLKEYTSRVKNIKLKVIKKCQTAGRHPARDSSRPLLSPDTDAAALLCLCHHRVRASAPRCLTEHCCIRCSRC